MNRMFFKRIAPTLIPLLLYGMFGGEFQAVGAEDKPQPLLTRWAKDLTPKSAWSEYPRPQLVRKDWQNLNGEWDFAIAEYDAKAPQSFPHKILVPFPIESYLGGVSSEFSPTKRAWYQREFVVDPAWQGKNLILHFGAVDWHAELWINGIRVGDHRGGYDPFSFEISKLVKFGAKNTITLGVSDPTDSGTQPRGKQKLNPDGIWYTPTSGIWQTVWLEPVPRSYIHKLKIIPHHADDTVEVATDVVGSTPGARIKIEVISGGTVVASAQGKAGEPIKLKIEDAKSWSPQDPFLYDLEVKLIEKDQQVDQVTSYFGMRSIELGSDRNGQIRMIFNGEPLFQFGPLDQGYWPDGLYTAPSDEALRYDLEVTKRLGFNMVRKHAKVEPARWYYWCDKLGLLVWQDMPSGDEKARWPADGIEIQRSQESAEQYYQELKAIVDAIGNSPCVVAWVPFNEAWGQFDTEKVTRWLKEYDPTRLVISASGGNDFGCGDINDDHFYPGPGGPPAERDRASVLGEFGGLGLPLGGHTWQQEENWGYRSFQSEEHLTAAYVDLVKKLRPLVESHLSAAVYTQTTDVEIEINGLMTYDREVIKVNEAAIRAANKTLFSALPARSKSEYVDASVLAWWRFEEGLPEKAVSDLSKQMGAIAAHDFSGHNNHLYAFSPSHAPFIGTSVPQRAFGMLEVTNKRCLNDSVVPGNGAATRDLYTNAEVSRTHMDKIDNFPLSDWTIEASFCLSNANDEQVLLTKEFDNSGVITPILQLGVFGTPLRIGVELIDEAQNNIQLRSDVIVKANEWWHVAIVCEDGQVKLHVVSDEDTRGFRLADEARMEGALFRQQGAWIVGRGSKAGKMSRDFHGWIDEVRVSTKSLQGEQLLFGRSK